jgi:hypothetical protein
VDPKEKDSEDEPFDFSGKTLDADGNLVPSSGAPATSRVSRKRLPHQELELEERPQAAALELEARPPPAAADYVPPPAPEKPGSRGGPGLSPWPILLLLAALGGGAWYYFFGRPKPPPAHAPAAIVILIKSEPAGAEVSVEGTPVGVTPWAADNAWGAGPVHVTLTAPGYRAWTGTFPGAQPARLEAHLQRK